MIYGCQIWAHGDQGNSDKIVRLQNTAIRTINFKGRDSEVNELYFQSKILKIEDLIKVNNCLFIHDFLTDSLPKCFENYYLQLNSMYFERTKNAKIGCLFIPFKKSTKYGLNSITMESIKTWNKLSATLKLNLSLKSRHELKTMLTNYFLSHYTGTGDARENSRNLANHAHTQN